MGRRAVGRVVVVGGGVIGLSCAWRLSQRGASVTVLDPAPGTGATNAAAGMLAAVTEAHFTEPSLAQLGIVSATMWESFAADLQAASETDIGYRRCGTLAVAADTSDWSVLAELLAFMESLGLEAEGLTGRQARAMEPFLAPSIRGAISAPGDHQVDNRAVASALIEACSRAGVDILHRRASEVVVEGGAVAGVRLAGANTGDISSGAPSAREGELETVQADTVVLAAGAWTPQISVGGSDLGLPIRPVRGHILRMRSQAGSPLLSRTVRGLVHGRPAYLVPRANGEIVLGATMEERGFDTTPQAGPLGDLLHDAREILPGLSECEFVEVTVGLRPGSFDNRPFVGRLGPEGLVVASGHHRNGILLAPLTAEMVASTLADEPESELLAQVAPGRTATHQGLGV